MTRERLDDALTADVAAMAQARAAASELTVRATAALAVQTGSTAVSVAAHPQRLAREALFLLVFGLRPAIKGALPRQLGAAFAGLPGGGTGESSSLRAEPRPVRGT